MGDLISIIIPVYKVEQYLGECIESIISQTYKNLEIILIDDGSPDNSGRICEEYAKKDSRIKVIHKENGGVSSARNLGLDAAKGEYVTFVDSDDLIHKEYIEQLYNNIVSCNSDMSFCKFSYYKVDSFEISNENFADKIKIDFKSVAFISFLSSFYKFKGNIMGSVWRTLYKKRVTDNIRFNQNIKVCEDLIFLLQAILNSDYISFVDEPLYFYRINNVSVLRSYKRDFLKNQMELYRQTQKIYKYINNNALYDLFDSYCCLQCYYLFSNELKNRFNANKDKRILLPIREKVKEIRKSELYEYFNLKNGISIDSFKVKIKFLITWFLVKTRLI